MQKTCIKIKENNMKLITAFSLSILSSLSFGFTGQQLIQGSQQTLAQAIFEVDQESIEAFQIENGSSEMHSIVRYEDAATGEDLDLEYGCHLHGTSVACHESGHTHLNKSMDFSDFYSAYLTSIDTLIKSFASTGRSLDSLESIKAWKGEHHKDADEGEVWVKYEYLNQGALATVYTMCHKHAGEVLFDCHFSFTAEDEPNLEDDHHDDDDHGDDDHDHDHAH